MVVEDYSVLVGLKGKYVGAMLFDEDESETYVVRVVQCDERKSIKYYEVTCVRAEQGLSGLWAVLPSSFVMGSDVVKGSLVLGRAHGPDGPRRTGALVRRRRHDFRPFSQGSGSFRKRRRVEKAGKDRRKSPAQGLKETYRPNRTPMGVFFARLYAPGLGGMAGHGCGAFGAHARVRKVYIRKSKCSRIPVLLTIQKYWI
jgi:hypothetical protein